MGFFMWEIQPEEWIFDFENGIQKFLIQDSKNKSFTIDARISKSLIFKSIS
jgi:hypothetical protein